MILNRAARSPGAVAGWGMSMRFGANENRSSRFADDADGLREGECGCEYYNRAVRNARFASPFPLVPPLLPPPIVLCCLGMGEHPVIGADTLEPDG